ncbi:hypothetical protein L1987_53152 [Smallanthus sonchifolius]|uniref:Uncharacterized protein n=1 Tax=Smallanthus sonchifolius TaxID=185202 RepID=A0ACB9EVJ5_9ASTR|nr:hypothetical protein L1987_53152 [Smallanthus sonchifolius]
MKAAKDRRKSYADKRRRYLEFQVGDMVLLKVSPWKRIIRFRKRGKLSPRFVGPYRILARVGQVTYKLDLDALSGIHPTFHVSHLRKCLADDTAHIPYDEIEVDNSLNYVEEPIAILDRAEKRLRNKSIPLVKVQRKHKRGSEATWEKENEREKKVSGLERESEGNGSKAWGSIVIILVASRIEKVTRTGATHQLLGVSNLLPSQSVLRSNMDLAVSRVNDWLSSDEDPQSSSYVDSATG